MALKNPKDIKVAKTIIETVAGPLSKINDALDSLHLSIGKLEKKLSGNHDYDAVDIPNMLIQARRIFDIYESARTKVDKIYDKLDSTFFAPYTESKDADFDALLQESIEFLKSRK